MRVSICIECKEMLSVTLTIGFNEHGPATPVSMALADWLIFKIPETSVADPITKAISASLTFEFGKGLLVAMLRTLFPTVLSHGVGRVEAQALLVIGLGCHAPVLPSDWPQLTSTSASDFILFSH